MKKSKALSIALCAVLLVAVSVMGTIAYLTSTASVVNTFTVGNVAITLDEAKVDEYGTVVLNEDRVNGNSYKLIPGHTYVKDPTMTVTKGSEESYVRMVVTISNADAVKKAFGENFLPQNYVTGWDNEKWPCVSAAEVDGKLVYEFRYYQTVDARTAEEDVELEALFETFTISGAVTKEALQELQSGFDITVEGHAIQAMGFENAEAAWKAFDEQAKKQNKS